MPIAGIVRYRHFVIGPENGNWRAYGSPFPDRSWIGPGVALLTAAALGGTIALAIGAEARGAPALDFLAPLVRASVSLVAPLRAGMTPWGVAMILAIEIAMGAVVVAVLRRRRPEAAESGTEGARWTAAEALGYGALITMSLALRFHAANLVPYEWYGETWSHIAAATDNVAMMRRALRAEDPFISQGLAWYAIEHVWTAFFGTSFAAGRVLQASVSFMVVPLLYGFIRRLAGPGPAFLGAALAALSPVEIGWSRSEYLFPYASAYAIVIAWTTLAAGESPRRMTLIVLSLEMAIGALVYPAARLLPVLPLVYLPFRWRGTSGTMMGRPSRLSLAAGALLFLVTPLALRWMVAGRIGSVDLLLVDSGGMSLWARTEGLGALSRVLVWLGGLASNVLSLARSLFVLCQDSWSTQVSSLAPKTLLSPVTSTFLAAGVVVALQRRRPRDLLVVLWIVLALLPALLSEETDARRFCAVFPAFAVLAATTAVEFLRAIEHDPGRRRPRLLRAGLIAAVVAGEALLRTGLYFDKPQGRPNACLVARGLRAALTPGTLLVVDLKYRYWDFFEGKLFLELFDLLVSEKGRVVWVAPTENLVSFVDRPRADPDAISGTALGRLPSAVPWDRVVFVLRDAPEGAALLARIAEHHPASRAVRWSFGSDPDCGGIFVVEAPRPPEPADLP